MTVGDLFLTGDYIDVQHCRPLLKTNIYFETLSWSSICSNHSPIHWHEFPMRGPISLTNWNLGSYVAY